MFYSPLRYPGGKRKLAKFIGLVCKKNDVTGHYIEPYAGGASVALFLLINGYVKEITINDYDRAIFAFWDSVLYHTDRFCKKIKDTEVTIENWRKFKQIYSKKETADQFDLGFATFFLNRTNRSGIINGGVIGGLKQNGKYKIDCRFKKDDLVQRIKLISKYKKNIHLRGIDAIDLIKEFQQKGIGNNTIFYFDPPYYLKGPSLYMNHYKPDDHKEVSDEIKKITNAKWIVSYDNVPQIRKFYKDIETKKYKLAHVAYEVRKGKELLFFSNNLLIPRLILK